MCWFNFSTLDFRLRFMAQFFTYRYFLAFCDKTKSEEALVDGPYSFHGSQKQQKKRSKAGWTWNGDSCHGTSSDDWDGSY